VAKRVVNASRTTANHRVSFLMAILPELWLVAD
jgi:hypothetical protein